MRHPVLLRALVSGILAPACAVAAELEDAHKVTGKAFGSKDVVVRTQIAAPSREACAGWRWGAEGECPRRALVALFVTIGEKEIFIPRSAFVDLGAPARIELKSTQKALQMIVSGGDAATAYTATFTFTRTELRRRRVFADEFRRTAWEETTYSFPK